MGAINKMKPLLATISILFMTFGFAHGIKTIDNPEQPVKKDTGKILQLKEVLQIHDNDRSYYFKYPNDFKISSNGDIFLCDENQLLKFGPDGKFIKNFQKTGQGPQEVLWVTSYLLENEILTIFGSRQNKIVVFNHETGEYIREFKLPLNSIYSAGQLFYRYDGCLFFHRLETVESKGKIELMDLDDRFMSLSPDGTQYEKHTAFSRKVFNGRTSGNSFLLTYSELLLCPAGGDLLYVSHTPEYNLKLYSFKTDSILYQFHRKYNRVEVTEETRKYTPVGGFNRFRMGGGQWYTPEVPKYHLDIQALFFVKGRLWVITSTTKDDKKVLVDVFDKNGVYEENFYIECPPFLNPLEIRKWIKAIDRDFLYAVEEDKDGSHFIKKYKIEFFGTAR